MSLRVRLAQGTFPNAGPGETPLPPATAATSESRRLGSLDGRVAEGDDALVTPLPLRERGRVPKEIVLPACLADAVRELFPTLDWSRIHYHDGYPALTVFRTPKKGLALPRPGRTNIYFNEGYFDVCDTYRPSEADSFRLLAHELVHALQNQESNWISARIAYLTCYINAGFSHKRNKGNCREDEAYEYQKVTLKDVPPPCTCTYAPKESETKWDGRRLARGMVPARNDAFWTVLSKPMPPV